MLLVILDALTLGEDIDFSQIYRYGEVIKYEKTAPHEIEERIKDASIIIVNKVKITADVLSSAKKLKLICETATGYDNIDIEYCSAHGIKVANTPDYSTFCVAQVTVTMACYLMTHINEYRDFVHSGKYSLSRSANALSPVYHEFFGKTWGIIGLGNIGRAVAKIAAAMGCNIIVNKQHPVNEYRCTDIETLAKESDIISIHCPLNDKTKNLIDKHIFDIMKNTAVIINAARGAVWNEQDAADALLSGKISGLGCDVYTSEPLPPEHPFSKLYDKKNVCLTPHMAWGSFESRKRCFSIVISNIEAFISGKEQNIVN